jgi:LysR family glycine cleavage system transcriptional activator
VFRDWLQQEVWLTQRSVETSAAARVPLISGH